MASRILVMPAAVPTEPLPVDQVLGGTPAAGSATLADGDGWEVGVWEHTVGASTDVEVDEVFVVLSGRATIAVAEGDTFDVAAGDAVLLEAGARTTWTVHETLRKIYVTLPTVS